MKDHRVHTMRCRLNVAEMAHVEETATHRGITISELTREALGLSNARKRKHVPRVDPSLLRQLIAAGTNLNQIAQALNTLAKHSKSKRLEVTVLVAELVCIERLLLAIPEEHCHDD